MSLASYRERAKGRYYRTGARLFCRRPFAIESQVPLVSFTFDDFPRSALLTAGNTLEAFGARGSYYAALSLMDRNAPAGAMFTLDDLHAVLERGHELGCHTFGHCHSWETPPAAFERSVIENQRALQSLIPGARFHTLAYPIEAPRVGTKRRMGKHFSCCRGGGQVANVGVADLNYLSAYFLEKSRDNLDAVREAIDANRRDNSWLIFATHDVSDTPSPYGCTPGFFEAVVGCAAASGARILPVVEAWRQLSRPVPEASGGAVPEASGGAGIEARRGAESSRIGVGDGR
jgi:peptidoglycan/xylan/chitin deacetylase (PgdA/CDA1 family)